MNKVPSPKRPWIKPELRTMWAGSAEGDSFMYGGGGVAGGPDCDGLPGPARPPMCS